jgi:uncharacterized damage-inducible protein DinB
MKAILKAAGCLAILFTFAVLALAQGGSPSGARGEILGEINGLEKKYVGLAQTMPQDKYSWRPAEGVRSVSEVFMHVAGANYGLPNFIGVKPPADAPKDLEKVTDKAEVVKQLTASFDFLKSAIMKMPDADLEKTAKMFGRDRTYREIGFFMTGHLHEHLGQSIAYARMNGVVPPWSQ